MKIIANRPFTGRNGEHIPFGQPVDASDEDARYYIGQGWAKPAKSSGTEKAIDPAMSETTGLDIDGRNAVEKEIDKKQIPEGENGIAKSVTEKPVPNAKASGSNAATSKPGGNKDK